MGGKRWTKEDEKFLTDNWGRLKIETISKKLNRSACAIETKGRRLNLGFQMSWYGVTEIAEILGLKHKTVYTYMKNGKIKSIRDRTKKKRYMATEESIMSFMKNYQDLWDTRKININLYERKPAWYLEKEARDRSLSVNKNSRWSSIDEKILIDRYRRGYNLEEIAKELNRSKSSVKLKLARLNYGINFKF